jgi:hypothetical protein
MLRGRVLIGCGVFLLLSFRPSAGQNACSTGWAVTLLISLFRDHTTLECSIRKAIDTKFTPNWVPRIAPWPLGLYGLYGTAVSRLRITFNFCT